jgi:hypothetical protein
MDSCLNSHPSVNLGSRSTLVSMCLVFMLIFLFIPWQVAFLGCWAIHLHTCATLRSRPVAAEPGAGILVMGQPLQESGSNTSIQSDSDARMLNQSQSSTDARCSNSNGCRRLDMHILLLMTWLLPLVAPVLAVWVRTLMTAGFTVPFDGDHNFLNVAPFLLLVDSRSSSRMQETMER